MTAKLIQGKLYKWKPSVLDPQKSIFLFIGYAPQPEDAWRSKYKEESHADSTVIWFFNFTINSKIWFYKSLMETSFIEL